MSKIRIRNFGPIKQGFAENEGWMDISKVTVFIGNQGSGKSTVAKLISTFSWIEKALTRGDYDIKYFSRKNRLRNQYLAYHRLENYFSDPDGEDNSQIEYDGDAYLIRYEKGNVSITEHKRGQYPLPQIMYVPAERNFIANVKTPKALTMTSDSLVEFVTEFDNAKAQMKGAMPLPISGAEVEYQQLNDVVYVKGTNYKIKLTEASSGFQSLVPLFLVTWYLANSVVQQKENSSELMTAEQRERFRKQIQVIVDNDDLTPEQKRIAVSEEARKFNKTAFLNIVEEPEQNLFPDSQWEMLKSLLEFNNKNRNNKLVITTHSPYIINHFTLAVKAHQLQQKAEPSQWDELNRIVPLHSSISADDLSIYELDQDGNIEMLDNYRGLPSDENYLNVYLGKTNDLFVKLLELEKQWR